MTPILNLRSILFSGKVTSIYEPNNDKLGKRKFSFTLELKTGDKKAQHKVFITCYETELLDKTWFREGQFVFCECYLVLQGFYVLHNISTNAYDCYKDLISRINNAFVDDNLELDND